MELRGFFDERVEDVVIAAARGGRGFVEAINETNERGVGCGAFRR